MQSNAPYSHVLTTQLNHLASLAKWLGARLQTKWLRVWIPMTKLESRGNMYRQLTEAAVQRCS